MKSILIACKILRLRTGQIDKVLLRTLQAGYWGYPGNSGTTAIYQLHYIPPCPAIVAIRGGYGTNGKTLSPIFFKMEIEKLNKELAEIVKDVYEKCALQISNIIIEPESKEYKACQFQLNGKFIICRNAKTTPKKAGQFVTFWKRGEKGTIEPFFETDWVDYYAVNVRTERGFGQFVFPKSVLIQKGIISTEKKEGKRAFRVYPPWESTKSQQAERTQKWQMEYFFEVSPSLDFKDVKGLYSMHCEY